MHKNIAEAISNIMAGLDGLTNDSKNNFANYKYVSIDAYYKGTRQLLIEHGLIIIPDELDSALSPDGKTLKVTYNFILAHKSGEEWDSKIRRSVYLPYTGAQSCGSALSYAEKFILRTLFKLPTGEESDIEADAPRKPMTDADAGKPVSRGQETKPIDYGYSGPPYRVFRGKEVQNSLTEIKAWGMFVKTSTKSNPDSFTANQQEWQRIMDEIEDHATISPKAKSNLQKAMNEIKEIADAD